MVSTFIKQKQEIDVDGDCPMEEPPDYGDQPADADQPDQSPKSTKDWSMEDYPEIECKLRDSLRKANVQPVDTTSVVTKSDPIPIKDVKPNWLTTISDGHYCGHNSIIESLSKDWFRALIENEFQKVSRWALNIVNPGLRHKNMLKEADKQAHFAKTHRGATIKSGEISITPSTELVKTIKCHRPIIAVRVFHGGAQAVINNVAYFFTLAI